MAECVNLENGRCLEGRNLDGGFAECVISTDYINRCPQYWPPYNTPGTAQD